MSATIIFYPVESFPLWILGVIVCLVGASDAIGTPAAQSMIPSHDSRSFTSSWQCQS
jgi:hypothetical protein